jgi:hypothetical protein
MGGTPSLVQGGATGILGHGLSGSHNKYESDASPTRPDLYEAGNNYKTVASQFQELIDYSPGGEVTLDSLTSFRSHRFDTQIANNPYFFNGPFAGIAVQPAAYTFIFRFMANHSTADPTGRLSYDVIKSWFGIQGESGSFTAVQGAERIPENWVIELPILLFHNLTYHTVPTTNRVPLRHRVFPRRPDERSFVASQVPRHRRVS